MADSIWACACLKSVIVGRLLNNSPRIHSKLFINFESSTHFLSFPSLGLCAPSCCWYAGLEVCHQATTQTSPELPQRPSKWLLTRCKAKRRPLASWDVTLPKTPVAESLTMVLPTPTSKALALGRAALHSIEAQSCACTAIV